MSQIAAMQGAFMVLMSFMLVKFATRVPMTNEAAEGSAKATLLLFGVGILYFVVLAPLTAILG